MIAGQAPSPKHSPTAYSAQDDQLSVAVPACSDCPVRRIAAIPVRDRPAWRAAPGITAELDAVQCLPRGRVAAGASYWRAGKPTPRPSGTGPGGCLRGGRYPSPGGLRPGAAPDFSSSLRLRADGCYRCELALGRLGCAEVGSGKISFSPLPTSSKTASAAVIVMVRDDRLSAGPRLEPGQGRSPVPGAHAAAQLWRLWGQADALSRAAWRDWR